MELAAAFNRFDSSGVKRVKKIYSLQVEGDVRLVFDVTYANKRRLAVKFADNSFTTPERIAGWHDLIERYNKAGIYAPRIVKTCDGLLCFSFSQYLVFAEEFKKYRAADEFRPKVEAFEYEEARYKMIGKIAALPKKTLAWNSPYCLYDTFSDDDLTDENYECAAGWCGLFKKLVPERKETIEEIWQIYLKIRAELKEDYKKLPKTAFQADQNQTNILLDANRRFVGILDFNIAGTETILNYCLCEAVPYVRTKDLGKLAEPEFLQRQDQILKRRLDLIQEHYSFSQAEKDLFPLLYNMVVPFRWPTYSCFREAAKKGKEHNLRMIDWVNYQIRRSDLKL